MKILDAAQMRNIDQRATERFGVPSIVLMENAAIAVVDALFAHYPDSDRVAILCGTGANGGDGFAVARHLENRGVVPVVIITGDRASIHGDALTNLTICERIGIPIYDIREGDDVESVLAHASDADVIVDAIFGTGLNRAPAGIHADVIRDLAELRIPVLAVDLPSGANASSPHPFEPCVQAEVTVTFAAPKICHVFEPAALYCGEVIVADITIPEAADGGYYLLGCRAPSFDPSVFVNIAWGTSTVLASTLERIAAMQRTVALLPRRNDIDTAADLEQYVAEGHFAP